MGRDDYSRERVLQTLGPLRDGHCIGYTSGVFDLLHAGHVDYLEQAKQHCDHLIVGINANSSVQQYKDPGRPIVDELERARIVAGLQAVDDVFIFDERNNNKNIELLKPDRYIKAGDYDKSQLSSAPIVESYGGSVVLIPIQFQTSTSDLIARIQDRYSAQLCTLPAGGKKQPAIFLDRDGTINKHVEYLHEPEKFEFLPLALEGMKALKDAGYFLVVVTNQAGIGMGYFTVEDFFTVNKRMLQGCSEAKVFIDKIYFSPDSKATGSPFRKPEIGMIERACKELPIDLQNSVLIGDSTSDIQCAKNAGIRSILVSTGNAGSDKLYDIDADASVANLKEASEIILQNGWSS